MIDGDNGYGVKLRGQREEKEPGMFGVGEGSNHKQGDVKLALARRWHVSKS